MQDGAQKISFINMTLKRLGSASVVFYTLPWLIFLLVAGTIAQRELGLFAAQHMFFSSWILWLGPIPLPGGYATTGLLTISLLAKFLLYSPWNFHRLGTILTHLGILVLLIGGLITALTQQEGYMIIGEGEQSQTVFDYHKRVLVIEKNASIIESIPFDHLKAGITPNKNDLPFDLSIESLCKNCRPVAVKETSDRHGLAAQMRLTEIPSEKENEANLSGLTLRITGADAKQDGLYITMEEVPDKPIINIDADQYALYISRKMTPLPFSITLNEFEKVMHPGTNLASAYSSRLTIKDGETEWPYLIQMNEPFRYKGYTFYQSSFSERTDGDYSILSVVQNKGRVFPYLASLIIFIGLLTHILIRLQTRKRASS
jgi:hypothetical protein